MEKINKIKLNVNIKKKKNGTKILPLKLDSHNHNADLNKLFRYKPGRSFLIKVKGDSMVNAGIATGDIVLVNKSAGADDGDIIVASINKKLVIKRLHKTNGNGIVLLPENPAYKNIKINPTDNFEIRGVVRTVIKMM